MILLTTDKDGRDLSRVTRIEDVSRPGSSLSKIKLFDGEKDLGTMEIEGTMRIEILPNVT
jgi:hypothetical protein